MFNSLQNVVVEGGSFVVNVDTPSKVEIDRLLKKVAPNAILNAGGRADEVRCFPGTREEVIGKLENWMTSVRDGSCKNRLMWLSGPAGAGKSAICQTVAERCPTRGQQAANFFFFRGDHTRNRSPPLVPTLVYQLRRFYPALDKLLTNCLTADPLICEASIGDQFLELISSPMRTLQQSSSTSQTVVLIVDGLDECDDNRKQDQILTALHALANADHSLFFVLIASRTEPNLVMSFNRLGTCVTSIFLDDQYRPRDDIYRFVSAKFDEIKQVHHLHQMLSEDWPPRSAIDAITNKSSGQFIYAATAMRFIEHSSESPDLSLVTVLGMQPSADQNPFAQLDAVYAHIFSQVRNMQSVKLILCIYFLKYSVYKSEEFLELVGYKAVQIKSLFANLGAIIQVNTHPIKLVFYHASLPDYLMSKSRSGDYYVDMEQITAELLVICLRNFRDKGSFNLAIHPLRYAKRATAELSKSLLNASICVVSNPQEDMYVYNWLSFIRHIERLYFETDRELFKIMLQGWIHFAYLNNIDPGMTIELHNVAASWYYKWYCVVEGFKSVLGFY